MIVIGKVYWVKDSVSINTTFNSANNKYQLTVSNVSPEDSAALEKEFGIKTKEGKEGQGNVLTAKSLYPFIFKNEEGDELSPDIIRNGSAVMIDVTGSYKHAFSKVHGNGASVFKEVSITKLEE